MLTALTIRNVVLIDRLDLDFAAGLTVLTGETGAGKSILLDALGLALGQRAESGLIGPADATATVTAQFDVAEDHPVRALVAEQGLEAEGPLVLRRQLGNDGRSRAFLNDQPIGVGLLRQAGGLLIEIEGQFEAQGLMDPATHRGLLDEFGDLAPLVEACRSRFATWRQAQRDLAEAREKLAAAERDAEYTRHALAELDLLDPKENEEEALALDRAMLANHQHIREAVEESLAELSGDRGAERNLAGAQRRLLRIEDKLGAAGAGALAALDRAAIELGEGLASLNAIRRSLDGDPRRLEQIEERLFALRDLARKHRVPPSALHAKHQEFRDKAAALADGGQHLRALEEAGARAKGEYVGAADKASRARAKSARNLERAVNRELSPLKLAQAKVAVTIAKLDEADWGETGWDRATFDVATNPGQAPGPIQRIASGGELARLMLAFKLALAKAQPVATLVFDEVDAGIGGATAAAVGERLKRLSADVQLLVVTHSPQVAALGDRHWRVDKVLANGGAKTQVRALKDAERREEIARMLSGASVTDEARAAAGKLLIEAQ
jgi:DNA repair protein RecN (Recombination protein N)